MRKYSAMLAAAALLVSSGIASAQSQMPRGNDNSGAATSGQRTTPRDSGQGTGMTGAPSSSNPQAGGGPGGLTLAASGPGERRRSQCRRPQHQALMRA